MTGTSKSEVNLFLSVSLSLCYSEPPPSLKAETTARSPLRSENAANTNRTQADVRTFVYDSWNLVRELHAQDSEIITNHDVWGIDLSGSLSGAGGIGGLLASCSSSMSHPVLFCYDGNGNVSELLSTSGGIAAHYEYSPFGKTIVTTGPSAAENPFRFSTKYFDDETGLAHYGYRYYSPGMGRWLSRDPIGEEGGLEVYGFVNNGVVNNFDALGLVGEGIISIGEIPGIAEMLNELHTRLLNKAVKVSGGTADKAKLTSWLAQVGPGVFIQLYAQALYDELQTQLEGVVRNIGVCHIVNLKAAGSGSDKGEIEVKEYSFPSLTKPWTWTKAPTLKRAMKYEPCQNNCYWRVYYYVPLSQDFTSWKEVERFSCSGETKCRKTF